MQLIENITIAKFDSVRELVSYPNGHLLVNSHTANLIRCLKQNTSIEQAHKNFCESQNIALSFTDFEKIVRQKLDAHGLVKNENDSPVRKKNSYLKLKMEILPAHYAAASAKIFTWLFRPHIFWSCFLGTFAINIIYAIFAANNISADQNFWIAAFLLGLSTLLHEMGHISAARYFGGKHGGIGIGFYFIWPVAYSDLTRIWELEKKKRVIINLGGIYFEYVCSSVLIFLSLVSSWNMLGVVAVAIAIKTTMQLNPFLRFDGYWVLCELWSQPNLMSRASSAVKAQLRSFFNSSNNVVAQKNNNFILLYGIANAAVGFVFLAAIFAGFTEQLLLFPQNTYELLMHIIQGRNIFLVLSFNYIIALIFYVMLSIRLKNMMRKIISNVSLSRRRNIS